MPKPPKIEFDYETVECRELTLGFPSGPIISTLYPEDLLDVDPLKTEGWMLRITCQKLTTVVKVHYVEYWSLHTHQGQRVIGRSPYVPTPDATNTPQSAPEPNPIGVDRRWRDVGFSPEGGHPPRRTDSGV